MLSRKITEADLFRKGFGPGEECLSPEQLEALVFKSTPAPDAAEHLKSCSYCQTELHLMQTFQAEPTGPLNNEVQKVAAQLQARAEQIFGQPRPVKTADSWWKSVFTLPRMAQASLALAALLLTAGVLLQFRSKLSPPPLNSTTTQTGPEVLRSSSFAVISPVGDVLESPKEIRWEKVPNAVGYRVRLLEVDRNELWQAETTQDHIDLPSSVRSRIVPAKTLFCEISALDPAGAKVGDTGLVRFRLWQKSGQ